MTTTLTMLSLVLAATPPEATLTVPLPEALKLLDARAKEEAPPAPVSAAVVSQKLAARVGSEALEVTASFTVVVLDGSRWSRLALLHLGPGVTLVDASRVEGGLVAVQGTDVVLVARSVGTTTVELKLSARGKAVGAMKSAQLCRGADALDGLLRLEAEGDIDVQLAGAELASEGGCWAVRWQSRAGPRASTALVARPPLEPEVESVTAEVVSTMEGKARLTVAYALALDREQSLAIGLPEGWTLTRLALNQVPRPVPPGRALTVAVGPARLGERRGLVTLTLERDYGIFHLAGRLGLELPSVGWPTRVAELTVHLPSVFEYHRVGGSLEPADGVRDGSEGRDDVEEREAVPGKRLTFRQYLVGGVGPTLELKYAVELEHRYFSLKGR